MLIRFIRWLRGYLKVEIRGYSAERFINLCSSKEILLWNLCKEQDGYEFYITVSGFRRLKTVVKKTKTRPYIKEKIGLPFFFFRYRKRKMFFGGIFLFAILLYVMSLFIWNVSVEGEYSNTRETLLRFLKEQDVTYGMQKSKLDCPKIEESIRAEYEDIGWVSAEIRGTRLIIKVMETNIPEERKEKKTPCHIIAGKDGIITSIITRKGTPKVRSYDVVKKGDILVSGILEILGDGGEIVSKSIVPADADIRMKTVYEYRDKIPVNYIKKDYTGRKKTKYAFRLFHKKINLFLPLKNYAQYDIIENEKTLKFGENFYLPFQYSKIEYLEYQEQKGKYTKKELEVMAQDKLNRFLDKLEQKGVVVLQNDVKLSIDSSFCNLSGKITLEESAVKNQKIQDSEWRDLETDEHNGDND